MAFALNEGYTKEQAMMEEGMNSNLGGMSIKEILEKVDLFNITVEEEQNSEKTEKVLVGKPFKKKDGKTVVSASDPSSAFLGPKLWDKPLQLPPLDDTEFSIMNIDDFLSENNISLDESAADPNSIETHDLIHSKESTPEETLQHVMPTSSDGIAASQAALERKMELMRVRASTSPASSTASSNNNNGNNHGGAKRKNSAKSKNMLPKDGDTSFLYAESKRARAERLRQEKRRKQQQERRQLDFTPEELALATVPGADFDPARRAFAPDELRPQPIIRKREKHYVPNESKTEKYWEKRLKNNIAARRSREARRLKENQIALRAAFLEAENDKLRRRINQLAGENSKLAEEKKSLAQRLNHYENGLGALN